MRLSSALHLLGRRNWLWKPWATEHVWPITVFRKKFEMLLSRKVLLMMEQPRQCVHFQEVRVCILKPTSLRYPLSKNIGYMSSKTFRCAKKNEWLDSREPNFPRINANNFSLENWMMLSFYTMRQKVRHGRHFFLNMSRLNRVSCHAFLESEKMGI